MSRNMFSQGDDPRGCEDEPYKCAKCGAYCVPDEMDNIGAVENGLCDKHYVENFGTFCDVCEAEIFVDNPRKIGERCLCESCKCA